MIQLKPRDDQILHAYRQAYWYEYGKRNCFNGNPKQKLIGILAQTMVADMLSKPRPNGKDGFDGGVDLIVNGKTIDVKCMARHVKMSENYVHNLCGYQKDYPVDYYIFTSFNQTDKELEICGVIDKDSFFIVADRHEAGETRERTDGSKTLVQTPMYEIKQKWLIQVNTLEDIERIFLYGDR